MKPVQTSLGSRNNLVSTLHRSGLEMRPRTAQEYLESLVILPLPVLHIRNDGSFAGLNEIGIRLAHSLSGSKAADGVTQLRRLARNTSTTGEIDIEMLSWPENGQVRWFEATALPTETGDVFIIARDATLEVNMRLALVDSRQRFKDLVEISTDFAWETDLAGSFSYVSQTGALGHSAAALVGTPARDLLYYQDAAPDHFAFETRCAVDEMEHWLMSADGDPVCVLASAKPTLSPTGDVIGVRGVCHDITTQRLRENDLARHKVRGQVIAYIVNAVRDEARPMDMLRTAVDSICGAMTDTACAVYQRENADSLNMVSHEGDLPNTEALSEAIERLCTDFATHEQKIGDRSIYMQATHYRNDMNGAIVLSRNATADWGEHEQSLLDAVAGQLGIALRQIADQRELERLSRTDALTGLLNRRAFMEELERALQRSRRNGYQGAIFFVDLNNFKAVNDTHGHDVGDRVLLRLSDILRNATRSYDFVARLGGDEFALWFENIDKQTARRRANEILRSCRHLQEFSGSEAKKLGLSIGIAMDQPSSVETSDGLLKRADAAMYRAKHSRKNNISMARTRDAANRRTSA